MTLHIIDCISWMHKHRLHTDIRTASTQTVLHDINQAIRYSTDILVLEHGKIRRQGSPLDVLTHQSIAEIYEVDADLEMRRGYPSIIINGLLKKEEKAH